MLYVEKTMLCTIMVLSSLLALLAFFCTTYSSSALLLDAAISRPQGQSLSLRSSSNNLDYEYIPPRNAEEGRALSNPNQRSSLSSSYPVGTPAGLRGEAVRSAIRSRCVGWNFSTGSPLQYGIVEVIGTSSDGLSQSMESLTRFLNGKFTRQFTTSDVSLFKEAAFLNAKGRLVDRIAIAVPSPSTVATAYLLTSPGHDSHDLYQLLDKFVFPFDQVQLRHSKDCVVFSLLSSKQKSIQECFDKHILQRLRDEGALKSESQYTLPTIDQCLRISLVDTSLIIVPTAGLPSCAGWGYTFCFLPQQEQPHKSGPSNVGTRLWQYLISEECPEGPIEVGGLEYETLRIECGQPAYNMEMTAKANRLETKEVSDVDEDSPSTSATPASPLELALHHTIDIDKGCYQGQEGIASILKNKRGPPRSLYQVVFPDETNIYDYQSEGEYASSRTTQDNLTRMPKPNDSLYVLGSNEEIMVGRITSVAEPSGTGEPVTLALALVRRPDSILSSMRQMGIEIPMDDLAIGNSKDGSLLIPPPSLDPLDGLEVIVGGTYTVGTLRVVPSRRAGNRKNLFSDDDIPVFVQNLPSDEETNDLVPLTKFSNDSPISSIRNPILVQDAVIESGYDADSLDDETKDLNKAIAEAEEAAKEAQRKAEKLETLRRRAEEAMERRKQKKT